MPETPEEGRLREANEKQARKIAELSNTLIILAAFLRTDDLLWAAVVDPHTGTTLGQLLLGTLEKNL